MILVSLTQINGDGTLRDVAVNPEHVVKLRDMPSPGPGPGRTSVTIVNGEPFVVQGSLTDVLRIISPGRQARAQARQGRGT